VVYSAGLAGSITMARGFTPLYQRVIDTIEGDIRTGRLKPGDQLPSTDQLRQSMGISPGTIRKGIDMLIDRGVLRGHQGLGVFVAEKS